MILELLRPPGRARGNRQILRVHRPRRPHPLGAGALHHREHGHRTGPHGKHFPQRRADKTFYERMNREGDWSRRRRTRTRPMMRKSNWTWGEWSRSSPALPSRERVPVSEAVGTPIHQVIIGSCTNGTFTDVASFAQVLRGRKVADGVVQTSFRAGSRVLRNSPAKAIWPTCSPRAYAYPSPRAAHAPATPTSRLRA